MTAADHELVGAMREVSRYMWAREARSRAASLLLEGAAEIERLHDQVSDTLLFSTSEVLAEHADALAAKDAEIERLRGIISGGHCIRDESGQAPCEKLREALTAALAAYGHHLAASQQPHEEGDGHITDPDDPGHLARVRQIAADHGFPLSDWTPGGEQT